MAQKLKFGNGTFATKKGSTLAYNDENNNYKPLPFTTTRGSIATRVNKEGLIEVVGNDVPRIDYTDSSDGSLLLEPQRSNLLPYSEDYSQSVFTRRNCTINQNYAISPSGLLDATLVSANGSDAAIFDNIGVTSGNTYTLSVYLRVESGTLDTTLSLGSAGFPNTSGDGGRVKDITITTEWKRFTLTSTADANAGSDIGIIGGFGGFNDGDSVLMWGAQLEEGSYPTSYIPTYGSTVTRQADTAIGAGNDVVFNDSEGVLFANIAANANDGTSRFLGVSDGSLSNRVNIIYNASNQLIAQIQGAGSLTANGVNILLFNKSALKYKSGDNQLWVSGFKVDSNTSTSGSTVGLDVLDLAAGNGSFDFYGKTKELGYYDTVLTDEELEYMTSYRTLRRMAEELNLNKL